MAQARGMRSSPPSLRVQLSARAAFRFAEQGVIRRAWFVSSRWRAAAYARIR